MIEARRLRILISAGAMLLAVGMGKTRGPAQAADAATSPGGRLASRYRVVPLELTGQGRALALRVNGARTVVGYQHVGRGTAMCVWQDGKLVEGLSGRDGMAEAINEKGQIVGARGVDDVTPFLYEGGRLRALDVSPGYLAAIAADVNEQGVVAGIAIHPLRGPQAVLFETGGVRVLGTLGGDVAEANAIGPERQVVGESLTAGELKHAFLWADGRMTDLGTLGGEQSVAQDINASGLIVGMAENADGYGRACVWENRRLRDLGVLPGGSQSWAFGCNRHGQICGWSQVINDQQHGVLWHEGRAIDLNDLLDDPHSWTITDARCIADSGAIAAQAERDGASRPVLLVPVFAAAGSAPAPEATAAKAAAGELSDWPSRRPMGRWIDETHYANDFVTPFRVTLPPKWRNEKPAGEPGLHVLSHRGEVTTDPRTERDPAQVAKAFVLWSVWDDIDPVDATLRRTNLGIEIEAIPTGQSFDEFVTADIERRTKANARRGESRIDPLVRTGEVWIDGRRCRIFDFDGFYFVGGFSTRTYFVEAGRHVVSFGWLITDPLQRVALADRMRAMVTLGPPLTPGRKADPRELALHRTLCGALAEAAREASLAAMFDEICDKEQVQVVCIGRALAAVEALNENTSRDRVRDFGMASGARDLAAGAERESAGLRVEYNTRLLQAAWRRLTPGDQALARQLRPDFARTAQGSLAAEPAAARSQEAAVKKGWIPFQFPDSPFWVDMPGQPKRSKAGPYEFATDEPKATFSIIAQDMGDEFVAIQNQPNMLEQLFSVISQSLIKHSGQSGGTLTSTSAVRLQRYAGRHYVWAFEVDGEKRVGCARFFAVDRHLVSVALMRPAAPAFDPQEKAFFNSLRIERDGAAPADGAKSAPAERD